MNSKEIHGATAVDMMAWATVVWDGSSNGVDQTIFETEDGEFLVRIRPLWGQMRFTLYSTLAEARQAVGFRN